MQNFYTDFQELVFLKGVCLVKSESSGNTAAINYANNDGSTDYGLFQVKTNVIFPKFH
jgi:hypothetical protein